MSIKNIILVALSFVFIHVSACNQTECGKGTVEENGKCVPLNMPQNDAGSELCMPGSFWNSELGKCFVDPQIVCGSGTEIVWDDTHTTFTCESTGASSDLPKCPDAQPGGNICITGRVKYLIDPDDKTKFLETEIKDPEILNTMEIALYDPLEYASVGSSADVLGYATIDATSGGFIATDIAVPSQGYVALVVRDKGWTPETADSTPTNWLFAGYAYKATAGVNIENTFAVAVPAAQLDEWQQSLSSDFLNSACHEHNLYKCGTWIGIYRDVDSGTTINGVNPYYGTNFLIPTESLVFLDKNDQGEYSQLTMATDRAYTSNTGIAMYLGAELSNYFGLCDYLVSEEDSLCLQMQMEFSKSLQGGSSKNTIFVEYVDGTSLSSK